jgi:sodium-dependent phosphate transporter
MDLKPYFWIVWLGVIFGFKAAFGIGANDVANAFATSVGSKALTIKQAVVIAAVFEFLGAFLLGSRVTDTVRKGIADESCFEDNPAALMHGMLCVIAATGVWLLVASKYEMPVSTTHSCVGGVIGMTMVLRGSGCVSWYSDNKGNFPFVGKVAGIVLSWFISPIFSGIFAVILFLATRHLILRSPHHATRVYSAFPVLVFICVTVNAMFVLLKGMKSLKIAKQLSDDEDEQPWIVLGISAAVGVFAAAFTTFALLPKIRAAVAAAKAKIEESIETGTQPVDTTPAKETPGELSAEGRPSTPEAQAIAADASAHGGIVHYIQASLTADPHAVIKTSDVVGAVHDNLERFDEWDEEVLKYMQIFTAMCNAFAHGANDVANSVGPLAAIITIYEAGKVGEDAEVPLWVLALGGFGIVVGLAMYGYKLLSVLGVKLCAVTPSRGYAIELGGAAVIIMGSVQGIPLSTTHCQVGATVGVALCEGTGGVNWGLLGKTVFGWVATLVIVGGGAGLLAAQGQYAPSATNNNGGYFPNA